MSARVVFVESNTTGTGELMAERALARGLDVTVLAADPARYPFGAHPGIEVRAVDTSDRAAIVAACRDGGAPVAAVVTTSEYFTADAAFAARALGLAAPDAGVIERCRDKAAQREGLAAAGVPVPAFAVAHDGAAAARVGAAIGYPLVCKPLTGSGSFGVRLCEDEGALRAHAAALLASGRNERGMPMPRAVLVEAVARGTEYSVEIVGGYVLGVVRKHLGPPPAFVEVGHDFPAAIAPAARDRLCATALDALAALGLGGAIAHVELRLDGARATVIEVNPRLAGGLVPVLIEATAGIDVLDRALAAALGEPGSPPPDGDAGVLPSPGRFGALRFVVVREPARITGLRPSLAARDDMLVDVRLTRDLGAIVQPHGDFRDRVGHAIACGATPEDAAAAAERAAAELAAGLLPVAEAVAT